MNLKSIKTFSIQFKNKAYSKTVGEIFEADDESAKRLIKIGLAVEHVEPKPSRKAKVVEEVKEEPQVDSVEEVVGDAIS